MQNKFKGEIQASLIHMEMPTQLILILIQVYFTIQTNLSSELSFSPFTAKVSKIYLLKVLKMGWI